MRIGTANIQNFPDHLPRQVAQDASVVAACCTLAGLQEIQPREDTPVIRGVLGPGWWMVGATHETPIVGRHGRWKLLDHNVIPFHRPADLPRPQNGHGAVTSCVVRSVKRRHLPAFAVVNVHLISGGFNGPRLPVLQERWKVEWGMFQDEVSRHYRDGLTVFTLGDLNNPRPPQLRPHGAFSWMSPASSPDHLGQLVQDVRLEHPRHTRVPLNSDHDLHTIQGPLTVLDES